jgi:hypothetical protein
MILSLRRTLQMPDRRSRIPITHSQLIKIYFTFLFLTFLSKTKAMRFSKLLLKSVTLIVFFSLIGGFVLYRTWYQKEKARLNKAKATSTVSADTSLILVKKDSIKIDPSIYLMSGSKSGSVVPADFTFDIPLLTLSDTLHFPTATELDSINKVKKAPEIYMWTSKSLQPSEPVFINDSTLKPEFKVIVDSILKTTPLKFGKKKKQ